MGLVVVANREPLREADGRCTPSLAATVTAAFRPSFPMRYNTICGLSEVDPRAGLGAA